MIKKGKSMKLLIKIFQENSREMRQSGGSSKAGRSAGKQDTRSANFRFINRQADTENDRQTNI